MDAVRQTPGTGTDTATRRRVLLIDADDGGRDMTRGLLKLALRGDVEITECGTLAAGIAALEDRWRNDSARAFDCVLLDCDLDGVQVPESLHGIAERCGGELPCPVIVLNGSDGAARAEAVFGAGAQDRIAEQWLSPPFLRRVLENAVERFAMQKRDREQRAALAEANDRLRRAGEAARIGHWRFDPAGGTAEVDETCAALFGMSVEEHGVPGASFERIHPDDRQVVLDGLARAAADDDARYEVEFRVVLPDGQVRWLAGLGDALRDDDGEVIGFTGVNRDVTRRRVAEAGARRSADLVRRTLDEVPFFVAVADPDGTIRSVNRTALVAGRVDESEIVGHRMHELAYWRHDPATVERMRRSVERAAGGEANVGEFRYDAGDGTLRITDHRCAPMLDADGEVTAVVLSGVDVTERVESEAKRTLALEVADMGTWEVALPGRAVTWDEKCRALFGLEGREGVTMGDAVANIHPEDRPRVERAIADSLDPATGGEYDEEYRLAVPGRAISWVRVVGRASFRDDPAADAGRVPERFFGVVMSTTDRVAAEGQRRLALESAEMGTWDLDLATGTVRLDERGAELQDLPLEAPVELAYEQLHPDDRGVVAGAIGAATDPSVGTGRYDVEYRVVGGGGGAGRWVRAVGRAVFGAGDGDERVPGRLRGVLFDVTARRAAQQRLREREAFNRALMEGSPDCVKVLDLDGRVLHMNGPGLTMMGYDAFE